MRDPVADPRVNDMLTCAKGDIRVDRVDEDQVFYVSWRDESLDGVPTRTPIDNWREQGKELGLRFQVPAFAQEMLDEVKAEAARYRAALECIAAMDRTHGSHMHSAAEVARAVLAGEGEASAPAPGVGR